MAYNSRNPPSRGNYRPPRDHRNDRDSRHRNGPPPPPRELPPPPPREPHRPSSHGGRASRDGDARWSRGGAAPASADYPGPPGVDNYRPPQGDFTFRVDKPAGVQETDSYRPQRSQKGRDGRDDYTPPERDSRPSKKSRGPPNKPRPGADARSFPDNRRGRGGYGGYGGRPWRPFIAAERELLKTDHNSASEVAFFNTSGGVTYRPLDQLSDSDEADMDISGDEAEAAGEPSHKRARLAAEQSASDNNTPKWSNPDPYTALPPETASQAKKKDVVQMIRKARVQAQEARTSLPSEAADFISFDLDDTDASDGGEDEEEEEKVSTAPAAPSVAPHAPPDLRLPPKPQPVKAATKPAVKPLFPSESTSSALGSRKRTHDDEIKMPHARLKKATKKPAEGGISPEWLPDPELDSTPWMKLDHSGSANMAVWLHKEVVDFYDYIRPRDFEDRLRGELVQELKKFCRDVFGDAEVYPFGSFPSGLYLPTADMDMVVMSDGYAKGYDAKYCTKNFLYRFRGQLVTHGIAWQNEIELIVGAKVPLVKFIEHRTGLKVDVSFENSTGLTAINTFKAWREQYPGMPALVTLIKHFLQMRGLNEPVNGGIGGFSVICLVVSMLQMMPEVQSGNLDTRHHLGQLLLQFFDLYGNKFNYETVAISMDPPRWIPKHQVTEFAYKNHNRLSIIDPNNPANDIAGGSSNAATILAHFSDAHRALTQHMAKLGQDPNRSGESILGVIMAGNYSSFEKQRNYLELLAKQGPGPTRDYRAAGHKPFQGPRSQPSRSQPSRSQPSRSQPSRSQPSRNLPPPPPPPRPPQGRHGGSRRRR